MRLYFENSKKEREHLSQVFDIQETNKIIKDFLNEHNYISYYTRIWYDPDKEELWFDVGSHSEFFVVTGVEPKSSCFAPYAGE